MKKSIFLVLVAVLLVCTSAGCIAEGEPEEVTPDKHIQNYRYGSYCVFVYVDEHTGVEYLVFSDSRQGGIAPRYNADGTLKINVRFRNDN